MADENYTFNVEAIRVVLIEIAETYRLLPGLVYTSAYDFLYQHGFDYPPVPWTGQYREGAQCHCYGNAIATSAMRGLRYVEGVAVAPTGLMIPHAWNIGTEGELVDVTWRNTGEVYIGVEFSVERADDATWNGDACVLDDKYRNFPVFQRRWKGEDYGIQWPASDRLDSFRGPDPTMPPSCVEWIKSRKSHAM